MLIQFRFKNYKSFRDDTILDLSATKITEYADRVIDICNEKLLPTAAIYGANASGKSNVIEAFRFMTSYVIDSFVYGGENNDKKGNSRRIRTTPFLFDTESQKAETSFEVYFIDKEEHSGKSYNYGFTLNQDGVVEEWLNYKAKTGRTYKPIFYRNDEELDLSGIPVKSQENIKIALEKETLIVSLGAKLKIAKCRTIYDWFKDIIFTNFGDPVENAVRSSMMPRNFNNDTSVQAKVVDYFASFDSSIVGFDVEQIKGEASEEEYNIDTHHRMSNGEIAKIPLEDESDGTLKMFALYQPLQDALETGGILCVDELNARLHPLLVRNFLITFLNPEINTKHAQLVFTTHDAWQLSTDLLRRDEIWFTEKDTDGASSLYSLADFSDEEGVKIRKDENYEKNYMRGKYGAIPSMKYFDMFKEE